MGKNGTTFSKIVGNVLVAFLTESWHSENCVEKNYIRQCSFKQNITCIFPLGPSRKYLVVDEDYVNNKENALWASLSQSRNLEDMAPFLGNLSVIIIDYKFLACFYFLGNCIMFPINFLFDKTPVCLQSLSHCSVCTGRSVDRREDDFISTIFTMKKIVIFH